LMVALGICEMWLLLLIHPSAIAQDGAGLNISDNQNNTPLIMARSDWCWRYDALGHFGRLYHF
jgi:hypothetical protein